MLLVSCANDVKFHESPSYELAHIYKLADSRGCVKSVSWCKDGSWLSVVPRQGNAEIIRAKENVNLLRSILGIPQPIAAVFQRTTKRQLTISTVNSGVLLYDIKTRNVRKHFSKSGPGVTMLDWNVKDTHLAASSRDGPVTLYSNMTNQKSSTMSIPDSKSVSAIRFHYTQKALLAGASDDGVVVVWDINVGKRKFQTKSHMAPVTDLVFSAQNVNLLVSVGLDRKFQCYDTKSGTAALSVLTNHPLSAIDMAPDGQIIAAASTRGAIYLYDLRRHQEPLKSIAAHSGEIRQVLFQPQDADSVTESVDISQEKQEVCGNNLLEQDGSARKYQDSFESVFNHVDEIRVEDHHLGKGEEKADGKEEKTEEGKPKETKKSTSSIEDSFFTDMLLHSGRRFSGPTSGPSDSRESLSNSASSFGTNPDLKIPSDSKIPIDSTPASSTRTTPGTNGTEAPKLTTDPTSTNEFLVDISPCTKNQSGTTVNRLPGFPFSNIMKSSTPKQETNLPHVVVQNMDEPHVSPVLPLNGDTQPIHNPIPKSSETLKDPSEMRKFIKTLVEEEVKSQLKDYEDVKNTLQQTVKEVLAEHLNEFKYQCTDYKYELSRSFINLQVCTCRQFLQLEETLKNFVRDSHNNCGDSGLIRQIEQLQQENEFLKNKINELFENC